MIGLNNSTFNAVITIMIFHALTPKFSGFTNMAFIFGRVLSSAFAILMPNISTNEHQEDCIQANDSCNKHW